MELVIEAEHVTEVSLRVGKMSMRLTREQVVQMLFGDDYVVMRASETGGGSGKKKLGRPPKSPVESAPPPPSERPTAKRPGITLAARTEAFKFLKKYPGSSMKPMIAYLSKKVEGWELVNNPSSYLGGILLDSMERGMVTREGEKGSYEYSLVGDPNPVLPLGQQASQAKKKAAEQLELASSTLEDFVPESVVPVGLPLPPKKKLTMKKTKKKGS